MISFVNVEHSTDDQSEGQALHLSKTRLQTFPVPVRFCWRTIEIGFRVRPRMFNPSGLIVNVSSIRRSEGWINEFHLNIFPNPNHVQGTLLPSQRLIDAKWFRSVRWSLLFSSIEHSFGKEFFCLIPNFWIAMQMDEKK